MGLSNFAKDLASGKEAELLWANILETEFNHVDVTQSADELFYDWDVKGTYRGKEVTYEIKLDSSAYKYAKERNRQANAFIEYKSWATNQPRAIFKSKAHYYTYMVVNESNIDIYVINRVALLHAMFDKARGYKSVKTITGGNSEGILVPLTDLDSLAAFKKTVPNTLQVQYN